jgi:hypothetical protein
VQSQAVNKIKPQWFSQPPQVEGRIFDPVPPLSAGDDLYLVLEDGRTCDFYVADPNTGCIGWKGGGTFP